MASVQVRRPPDPHQHREEVSGPPRVGKFCCRCCAAVHSAARVGAALYSLWDGLSLCFDANATTGLRLCCRTCMEACLAERGLNTVLLLKVTFDGASWRPSLHSVAHIRAGARGGA